MRVKADEIEAAQYTPELPAEVPAGAALFADARGLDATLDELRRSPALSDRLGAVAKALGGLLDDAIGLFKGEAALYVRRTAGGPEATLVIKVSDQASAEATVERLVTLAGALGQRPPESLRIAGVPATRFVLGKRTYYDAVFGGKVVVTTAKSGIRGLLAPSPRLAGSSAWRSATSLAAMPDDVAGIVYADVPRLRPLVARLGAPAPLPAELGRLLLFGSVDADVLSVRGFAAFR